MTDAPAPCRAHKWYVALAEIWIRDNTGRFVAPEGHAVPDVPVLANVVGAALLAVIMACLYPFAFAAKDTKPMSSHVPTVKSIVWTSTHVLSATETLSPEAAVR